MDKSATYVLTTENGEKKAFLQLLFDDTEISQGSSGESVSIMQFILYMLGYSLGSDGIDGVFGSATKQAVKDFQAKNGLTEDGICGVNTWEKLLTDGE